MQMLDGRLIHSASDLNAFSECVHLVALARKVAAGSIQRPLRDDPTAELLARKGNEHEARHLERLRELHGDRLVAFEDRPQPNRAGYAAAEAESIAAMDRGAPVIYQATFFDGTFLGRADFLQRVEWPCRRWPWSYEVVDTKLALSPKPYFLVQLCNYSEHVERIAGSAPEHAAIVLGTGETRRFAVAEFAAYYRRLKAAYLASIERADDAYPFECAHCDLCAWRDACAQRRDADDHLSLVAGIRRDQMRKLNAAGIDTLAALAAAGDALRPKRLTEETFENLRAQAAEQHRYRAARGVGTAAHSYRFRPSTDDKSGFARLPQPNPGDIFFDIEGDPMYRPDRGLEYLFGIYLPEGDRYLPFWGTNPAAERSAFETFVDFVVARQVQYPDLHVYHYAPYETTVLKRLMGRFASRENAIDRFLRAGTFVDLYPVVKQSIWVSQPSYSIKKIEALYGFTRSTQTRGGDDSIVMFESWLESGDPATLEDIRAYNEDDCRSTYSLRDWLVRLRDERNQQLDVAIPWRDAPPERPAAESIERSELEERLLRGIPVPESLADLRQLPDVVRARWLLGNLLNYHRREQKPEWWEYFYRLDHPAELIDEDTKSLGGLEHRPEIPSFKFGPRDRNFVQTYSFPEQEHEMREGDEPVDAATGNSAGEIISVDDRTGTLQLKLRPAIDPPSRLKALIPGKPLNDQNKRAAIEYIAQLYDAGTLGREHPATLALLLGRPPRLTGRPAGSCIQPDTVTKETLSAVIGSLDHSHLVVQGPPGSGKSTMSAHAIVDLLAGGLRVALAAHSHKAVHNLLHKIERTAQARDFRFRGCHKSSATNPGSRYVPEAGESLVADAPKSSAYAGCSLVSATTFAWAEAGQRGAFDFVVIDEAGQVSLADALVTSLVARNVVLLGDPQQLPQVAKGSHPLGADRSVLEHLLDDAKTIAETRGVFLDRSYRMQPEINDFVSRVFYDGRLAADAENGANRVRAGGRVDAGPRFVAVAHEGNARRSAEEADRVVAAVDRLMSGGSVVVRDDPARPLTPADILVVTPYNIQRTLIGDRLAQHGYDAIRVGTVDKFQGQEAPVVFYSLTASSADLAPRGLEFLLNPNRLNVAVSRAQVLSIVLCSPDLLASRAMSVEQMRLLNLLCVYAEEAGAAEAQASLSAVVAQLQLPLGPFPAEAV